MPPVPVDASAVSLPAICVLMGTPSVPITELPPVTVSVVLPAVTFEPSSVMLPATFRSNRLPPRSTVPNATPFDSVR